MEINGGGRLALAIGSLSGPRRQAVIARGRDRVPRQMTYLIPALLFLAIVAGAIAVIALVSKKTAGPDGEKRAPFAEDLETPLWATDEGSDAPPGRRRPA